MTTIKIEKLNNHINKIEASGHSGFEKWGKDTVCAAISSIIQTAVLGVKNIAQVDNLTYVINEKSGYLCLTLPSNLEAEKRIKTDSILETMLLGLQDLKEGYSNYIDLEVIENVY